MFLEGISVFGLLLLVQNIDGNQCPRCGGKVRSRSNFDEDDPILAKCFGHSIIRPKPIPIPPFNLPFPGSPPKGPCFRRTAIVKPAVIPRPIYVQPDCKPEIGTNDSDIAAAAATAAQMLAELSKSNCLKPMCLSTDYRVIDVSKAYQQALAGAKPSFPADCVSLSLAYKMYQDRFTKKVCEDGLTYGFRKLPLENCKPAKRSPSIVSEGNLHSINGQIVELKPVAKEASCDSLSTEAMDELVDLACNSEINDMNLPLRPTLTDVGYIPAKIPKVTFIDIPPLPTPCVPSESPGIPEMTVAHLPPIEPSVPPTCTKPPSASTECPESGSVPPPLLPPLTIEGFKPGKVVYEDCVKSEHKEDCSIDKNICECHKEVITHIPVPAPPCGCHIDDVLDGIRTYA